MALPLSAGIFGVIDRTALAELRPGLLVAFALGVVATFMSRGLGGPLARSPLLIAILIGVLIGNSFGCPESFRPGLTFTIRRLLRLAVALVGFRITLHQVADLGIGPFVIAMCILAGTFLFTLWVAQRFFGVEREMGYLLAAGTAVCGAAAILATAEIVRARPQQTTIAVTLITVLGTLTLLAYPVAFTTGISARIGRRTRMACSLGPRSMKWRKSLAPVMPSRSWPATQRLWLSSARWCCSSRCCSSSVSGCGAAIPTRTRRPQSCRGSWWRSPSSSA